ncbi:MAG: phospholipase D family protein [Chloroflexota bacterium]|nr:phospholipase D family protein [Chloroflexota bacterium]
MKDILGSLVDLAQRLSTLLFLPVRTVLGRFHRRRHTLTQARAAHPESYPPLPPPWSADNRWFPGGCPPRARNELVPLIHGVEYFTDLVAELQTAQQRVTICEWCLTPLMALLRENREGADILADALRQVSQRVQVYVLLWSGAPSLFEPTTHMVKEAQETLLHVAPLVECRLDHRAAFSHDHHQKAVTIDGRVAYVGGIDLTTFQGDRWDTAQHPLRFGPNWHDVQARIRGEAVQDVEENFCQRWNAVTGEHLQPLPAPEPDPAWLTPVQVVRTVPAGFYPFAPNGEYGIAHAYLTALRRAERFIYLENQYLWSPEIVDALIEAMNRPHNGPFRIAVVLPARAYSGKYDNDEHVRRLNAVDAGRGIFHAYSIYAHGPAFGKTGYRYLPIYVHAKVAIVDDQWLTIGSANLNGRGLATDTEMNVQAVDPAVARALRVRLWAEHLGMTLDEVAAADPSALIDGPWKAVSSRMAAAVHARSIPPGGQAFPYTPGANPGSRAMDVLESLTLEH